MTLFSKFGIDRILPMFHDMFGRGSGGRDRKGPPDVDKLWSKFNERITRIFRRKKKGERNPFENNNNRNNDNDNNNRNDDSGGKDDEGRFSPRRMRIGAIALLSALTLGYLGTGLFIVHEGQTGVVMTFGSYSYMTPSGVNWRYPWPIQSVETVNVLQVRTVEIGYRHALRNKQPQEALMLTNDENIVDIQLAVQYRLKNAADWVFSVRDQEETVRQVAETAIREIVGRSQMDFVLYEGRDRIALDTQLLMQEIFDMYRAGVQITNVTMQGVQPPEQVQAAFDDAVKAGQDLERQKNEGEAYANAVIPRARGTAARLMQEAEGYRDKVVANAEGNAARFRMVEVEYRKAPGVTRDRLYLEAMQEVLASTTKLMVDARNSNNLLYLPLDKLLSYSLPALESSAETAAAPGADTRVQGAAQSEVDAAGRVRGESRDRGGR